MIINQINQFALNKIPFIVIINYDISKIKIIPLELAAQEHIFYEINGKSNYDKKLDIKNDKKIKFEIFPVLYKQYLHSFNIVYQNLMRGNSYLTNLTFPTKVKTNYTLYEIFTSVSAPCKLFYKDEFVCFSPEPFVSIEDNIISSFPMKGTIDANIENAETIILNNFKEIAEHNTIVDLIRNDLNMVAENVYVKKFKYLSYIKTNRKNLIQMSSQICGELENSWESRLGNILLSILPAGSVTGAPKKKTLEIIKLAEPYDRGWYTGIFGIFDGKNFYSYVMIRYIEKKGNDYYFKSGGGITVNSCPKNEYQEMINKVYVPIY